MSIFVRFMDKTSDLLGKLAGIFIVIGMSLVIVEIVLRKLFNSTLYITEEYSAYALVAITFFSLSYALKEKAHVRLEFLNKLVKGRKGKLSLDIYSNGVGLIVFSFITFAVFEMFIGSVDMGSRSMQVSRTYLAIPQFAMPLGSLAMTLQFAAEMARAVVRAKAVDAEPRTSER